jgi:hypothetical protein
MKACPEMVVYLHVLLSSALYLYYTTTVVNTVQVRRPVFRTSKAKSCVLFFSMRHNFLRILSLQAFALMNKSLMYAKQSSQQQNLKIDMF